MKTTLAIVALIMVALMGCGQAPGGILLTTQPQAQQYLPQPQMQREAYYVQQPAPQLQQVQPLQVPQQAQLQAPQPQQEMVSFPVPAQIQNQFPQPQSPLGYMQNVGLKLQPKFQGKVSGCDLFEMDLDVGPVTIAKCPGFNGPTFIQVSPATVHSPKLVFNSPKKQDLKEDEITEDPK
jgi:hypothetical protein